MSESTSGQVVTYTRHDRVAIIALNRPPVNALSTAMYEAICANVDRIGADEAVSAAVLTSSVSRAFCAGADIKEIAALSRPEKLARAVLVADTFAKVSGCAVPVICAINGPAVGAGLLLAACCDIRLAASTAHVRLPEIDRGAAGGGGAIVRRIGVRESFIREMYFTGRKVPADLALEMGIVDEVAPAGTDVVAAALQRAQRVAEKSRAALIVMKSALNHAQRLADWEEAHRSVDQAGAEMLALSDSQRTLAALLDGSRSYHE